MVKWWHFYDTTLDDRLAYPTILILPHIYFVLHWFLPIFFHFAYILSLDDVENTIFNFFIFSPSFFFHLLFLFFSFSNFGICADITTELDKKNHSMFILLFDKFQAGLCETCLRKAKKIKCTWKFPTRTVVITDLDEYTRQSI